MNKQEQPKSTIGLGVGVGVWKVMEFFIDILFLSPAVFVQSISFRNIGEQRIWSSLLKGLIFWAVLCGLALASLKSGSNESTGGEDAGSQASLFDGAKSPAYMEAIRTIHQNPESLTIERSTILLFFIVGCICMALHCLDLWRRDLTRGTYVLSINIGEPRLPVGFWESSFYWLVPAAICGFFHLYWSAFIFNMACVVCLGSQLYWQSVWRLDLLNQRDGHLMQEILEGNEIKVIGLRAALRMAGSSGQGAIQHNYENLH